MEKASCFKVTVINMLKDLGQKADNNKNEQMICIIRGLDIIKEQSNINARNEKYSNRNEKFFL